MNTLEEKVRANETILSEKFINKDSVVSKNRVSTKTGFTDGWDKGWGNHGGPPRTGLKLKSEK
jgi:hypothetical protein